MIFWLSILTAQADPSIPAQYQLPVSPSYFVSDTLDMHGPDGPPPDGGYTINDDGGQNMMGKVGVLCLGAGIVTGVLTLTAQEGSEDRTTYQNTTVGLLGSGVGFIVLERIF